MNSGHNSRNRFRKANYIDEGVLSMFYNKEDAKRRLKNYSDIGGKVRDITIVTNSFKFSRVRDKVLANATNRLIEFYNTCGLSPDYFIKEFNKKNKRENNNFNLKLVNELLEKYETASCIIERKREEKNGCYFAGGFKKVVLKFGKAKNLLVRLLHNGYHNAQEFRNIVSENHLTGAFSRYFHGSIGRLFQTAKINPAEQKYILNYKMPKKFCKHRQSNKKH